MTPVESAIAGAAGVAGLVAVERVLRRRFVRDLPMPGALFVLGPGVYFTDGGDLRDLGSWSPGAIRARRRVRELLAGALPWPFVEDFRRGMRSHEQIGPDRFAPGEEADRLVVRRHQVASRYDTGEDKPEEAFTLALACAPQSVIIKAAWASATHELEAAEPVPLLSGVPGRSLTVYMNVAPAYAVMEFFWAVWMRRV